MTFGQFLSILRARLWVALAVFFTVVIATVAVSLLLPKQYTGSASVVIDIKPDPVSAMTFPAAATAPAPAPAASGLSATDISKGMGLKK